MKMPELDMTTLLQLAADARRLQEFAQRWPEELRAIRGVMCSLATEFQIAGGEASVGELRSSQKGQGIDGINGVYINFTALPGQLRLLEPAYLSLGGDYQEGKIRVQKSTNALSWLSVEELHVISEEQLVLEELLWSIKRQFKLRDVVREKTSKKRLPREAA
jgi:hypothetical protein